MIELVLIQKIPDEPSVWLVRRGFRQKGLPTAFFNADELSDIGITPTTLVFGGAATTRPLFSMPDDLEVWVSEVVPFVSEWRFFVRRDRIVGYSHYEGDPLIQPDMTTVRAAVEDYLRESPAAYGIDFGVTADGRTLLVEVNDAYCLGCMSLPSAEYARMIEDRWVELMTGRCA